MSSGKKPRRVERQLGAKPRAARLNAFARRALEANPGLLGEVGLEVDAPPEGENPWNDPQYQTIVELRDTDTDKTFYHKIQRVHIPHYRNPEIYISGILKGLSGKPMMTAWTLCEEALNLGIFMQRPLEARRGLNVRVNRVCANTREMARAMSHRLEKAKEKVEGFVLLSPFGIKGLHEALSASIAALRNVEKQAERPVTTRDEDKLAQALIRASWIFDRPALAYALHKLLKGRSEERPTSADLYARIAKFENRFFRSNVSESGDSIRREIARFKRGRDRMLLVDRVVGHLLSAPWYTWPPQQGTN